MVLPCDTEWDLHETFSGHRIRCDEPGTEYADFCDDMLESLEYIRDQFTDGEVFDDPNEQLIVETIDGMFGRIGDMHLAKIWASDSFLWNAASRKGHVNNWEYDDTIQLMRIDLYVSLKDEAEMWHYINFRRPKEVSNG